MFDQEMDNMPTEDMEEDNPYIVNNANIVPNYYADGGMVENEEISPLIAFMGQNKANQIKDKPEADNNPYPSLAEMIREQGEGEDTVLAHINPIEAEMLSVMSNGGSTNPITGLPQFGFFNKPGKAIKGALGGGAGALLGNMIMPGIGGIIGGALGGAASSAIRGRKDFGNAALRGAMVGASLPSAASLAGSGANALGMKGLGQTLSNYGNQNSILNALGLNSMGGGMSGVSTRDNYITGGSSPMEIPVSELVKKEATSSAPFMDMLASKSKSFFSDPQNLLTTAILGGSLMNRPKAPREKSPEELAGERKRYELGLMLSAEEQAAKEAADLAAEQSRRRIARNKFLPEERFQIEPLYVKTNSPDDYKKKGRWLEYYNNPQMLGNPLMMKDGGEVKPKIAYEMEEFNYPAGLGFYVSGQTGGQDDKIPAMLSDGEYVIPADTVAHLGDGNNNAGATKLDEMVKKIRTSKGMKNALPPKTKSLTEYIGA